MKITVLTTLIIMNIGMASCSDSKGERANAASKMKEGSLAASEVSNSPSVDIHSAAYLGDITSIQKHIKAGTNLNDKDQYGSTPLIIAITFDREEVSMALIEAGADLSVVNNDGSTALHIASFLCRPQMVKVLLDAGADKSPRNNYGATALETVTGPFEQVKPIYEQLEMALQPLGFKFDYTYLEKTRPQIAEMLK